MSLLSSKCKPCEDKDMKPYEKQEIEKLLGEITHWSATPDSKKIFKEFTFTDFVGSMHFINQVADIAEVEGHHPDIHIFYNKVLIELWTHSVGGLTENDFIVAAKIDAIWK